jgi:hypothetical protein
MASGHVFHHTSRDLVTVVVLKHQTAHRAVKPLHHTIVITSEVLAGFYATSQPARTEVQRHRRRPPESPDFWRADNPPGRRRRRGAPSNYFLCGLCGGRVNVPTVQSVPFGGRPALSLLRRAETGAVVVSEVTPMMRRRFGSRRSAAPAAHRWRSDRASSRRHGGGGVARGRGVALALRRQSEVVIRALVVNRWRR